MIFYLTNGSHLVGTQADARALDKDFVQLDIPVDKAGLMAFVNELYDRVTVREEPDIKPDIAPEIIPLGQKIESWFEPVDSADPITRILTKADYPEALRINQLSVERMVAALIERKTVRDVD